MKKERSWTDEQLREAVASSTSYRQVLRALSLKYGSFAYIRRCIGQLGIPTAHFDNHPRNRKQLCADDRLRELVAGSETLSAVIGALGIEKHSNAFYKLRRHIAELDLDTSHMKAERNRATKWSEQQLRAAVASSRSYSQAIRALGLIPAGGNFQHVQRNIAELRIDTSRFTGMGWNIGGKFRPRPAAPLEEVLVENRWTSTHNLKIRLLNVGLKNAACEVCGWCARAPDGRIPVELDHINGDRNDNRLDNLRILCPNCHSLQPTHRGLNKLTRRQKRS